MIYQQIKKTIILVLLLAASLLLIAQQPPQGFQELYEEYGILSQQLRSTQQLAMQDPEIVKQSEEFSEFIDVKLKEQGTEVAELVDERNEVIEEIETARENQDQESEGELQPKYQQISQKLQPYIETVFEDSAVQERQAVLEALMIEKMKEIDPESEQKMDRLEEITEEIQKMME
jgi:uncharacterized protein YdcH (DUF465 family)